MADEYVLQKVHDLSDIELAALLSLINREHCMISTPADALDDLIDELQLISTKTFGLKSAVVDCTPHTTLDDFASSLLYPSHHNAQSPGTTRSLSPLLTRTTQHDSYFPVSGGSNHGYGSFSATAPLTPTTPGPSHSQIANVILAKNLDRAPKAVQIQALELLRTKRIFTRTSVQTAPKQFMLIAVLGAESGGEARVTPHLNDFFYVSHWHDPEDGFANLEEEESGGDGAGAGAEDAGGWSGDGETESMTSAESVIKKWTSRNANGSGTIAEEGRAVFSERDIASLSKLSDQVSVDVDVLRYHMNIVSFLRMHRAVAGGVSPTATRHFEQLMK